MASTTRRRELPDEDDDPTQGGESGDDAYEDPTQGDELGAEPGEDSV